MGDQSLTSSGMASQPMARDLPLELFFRVLSFLSPLDIVRLQVVSKRFHDITHDITLWRTLYTNAKLPRPPGPFPFQSLQSLAQTLVRSAKLAETWTSQPIRSIGSEDVDVGSLPMGATPAVIGGGRWLVSCESYKRIVLYDMEFEAREMPLVDGVQDSARVRVRVLWEDEGDEENLKLWDACSVMRGEELVLYVIHRHSESPTVPWKMLEFRLDRDTGYVNGYTSLQVPQVRSSIHFAFVHLVPGQGLLVWLNGARLVLDAETRIFYRFPEVDLGLPPGMQTMGPRLVLLTNIHVVVLYTRHDGMTFIQVFTTPSHTTRSTTNGAHFLQLTHQGQTHHKLSSLHVIKQSSIHPRTGTTTLRFLESRNLEDETTTLQFRCIDLELADPDSKLDVALPVPVPVPLPLSVDLHDLFSIEDAAPQPLAHTCATHLSHSPDGHVRGIYLRYPGPQARVINPTLSGFHITKFTLDASAEELANVWARVSEPMVYKDEVLFRPPRMTFDGVRGRFYYGDWRGSRRPRPNAVVGIVDVR